MISDEKSVGKQQQKTNKNQNLVAKVQKWVNEERKFDSPVRYNKNKKFLHKSIRIFTYIHICIYKFSNILKIKVKN